MSKNIISLPKLSEEQENEFTKRYYLLLQKWKGEFKPTLKEKISSIYSKLVWGYMMRKDWKTFFEQSIKKRIELKRLANNKAEEEIIDCWVNMDMETIKWKDQINKQIKLLSEQKILIKAFNKKKDFINALNLYKNQIELLNLSKISSKSIMYKVKQQQRIYELSKQLEKNKSNKVEILALGIITDLLSRNNKLIGTTSALIYSKIKGSEADFRNSILLTEKLKMKVEESKQRTKIISDDLNKLLKIVKNV